MNRYKTERFAVGDWIRCPTICGTAFVWFVIVRVALIEDDEQVFWSRSLDGIGGDFFSCYYNGSNFDHYGKDCAA